MPSPVAHSLAALAVAGLAERCRVASAGGGSPGLRAHVIVLALIVAANAPDFDFVPGVLIGHPDWLHRGISHSLGAALLAGACAGLLLRAARIRGAALFGLLMAAAYASHLLLDMFSPDPLRFNGVPLLWPLSERHLIVPAQLFLDIRRDSHAGGFLASLWQFHNVQAVVREALIMAPLLLAGRLAARIRSAIGPDRAPVVGPGLNRRVDSES